ncbi:hypothetical protein VW23_004405 [Devosia insulae DS-56]|uniref:Response regulatory domain-containing protein n=1 Tax=Devosia insulae DS-56 TaxID=1116389 RepID=A0A1E5XIU4_9HYPH|nr:response regulator [Devosia insulae]OEO28507.1 hypothetical protein VW23_004405 [Devosia insulae DS-56]
MTDLSPLIAVVDDDQRLLESLENLLESAGYRAITLSRPELLFEPGRLQSVDCVITDISMPGIDGFELRDRVIAARPGLPVILMSGRHEIAEQIRARTPPEPFFRKPFDGRALLDTIERLIASSRA